MERKKERVDPGTTESRCEYFLSGRSWPQGPGCVFPVSTFSRALTALMLHVCISVQDVSTTPTAPVLSSQPFAFKMCTRTFIVTQVVGYSTLQKLDSALRDPGRCPATPGLSLVPGGHVHKLLNTITGESCRKYH